MLCCVGGPASRMGDLLGPPPRSGGAPASRMGDLLGPPPASRMGDLLGPPPAEDPWVGGRGALRWAATYEFLGTFGRGRREGLDGWVRAGRLGGVAARAHFLSATFTDCRLGSGGWA